MLHLRRITNPYEWERDKTDGSYITFGEYYYWDDTDDFIISAVNYRRLQKEHREDTWDYSLYNKAQNEREYQELWRDREREFLTKTVLERKVDRGPFGA